MKTFALVAWCICACAAGNAWADASTTSAVKRGEYLAIAGDCVACHAAPGGQPFAGGLAIATPIGSVIATNITPSKTHGIGNYTQAQFADAVRLGIRADGAHLYPAMPYTAYALFSDEDTAALFAYFMQDVKPVDASVPPTQLPFPFNIRASMAAWNLLFLDRKPFAEDPGKSAQWNRGAYLVRGPAHCGACHTPRNLLMAESSSQELAGAELGAWFAPNITSDADTGIGGWSDQDIVDYLRTGRAKGKAQAAGPMTEAIDHSLQFLSDADLHAIATYLRTVPAQRDPGMAGAVFSRGKPANQLLAIRGSPVPDDPQQMNGAQLYDAHCATCHQASGEGSFDGAMPSLFHNTATGRGRVDNLVMVILDGIHRGPHGDETLMPGFAKELSDAQIALLATYVVRSYANPNGAVSEDAVREAHNGGPPSHLVLLARLGLAGAAVLLILIVIMWRRRRIKD